MDTVSRETTMPFSLLSPFSIGDQLLKKRICSSKSKFFLFGVHPSLDGFCHPGSKQEVLFIKIVENINGPIGHALCSADPSKSRQYVHIASIWTCHCIGTI